jgi:hypothetical protein
LEVGVLLRSPGQITRRLSDDPIWAGAEHPAIETAFAGD